MVGLKTRVKKNAKGKMLKLKITASGKSGGFSMSTGSDGTRIRLKG